MIVNGLILAAGMSQRMGAFKPLLRIGSKTLLEWSIDSMLAGGAQSVTVVLGYRAQEVEAALHGAYLREQLQFVRNARYEETDMLASVKLGVCAMQPCDAFVLLPGDMPAVHRQTFLALRSAMQATHAKVVFPTVDGYRKHPPLIDSTCIPDILAFEGNGGLRQLWQTYAHAVAEVAVQDQGCLLDADTMDDFQRLTAYLRQQEQP